MTIWRWEEFSRCDKFPTTPEQQPTGYFTAAGRIITTIMKIGQYCNEVTVGRNLCGLVCLTEDVSPTYRSLADALET